MRWDKTIASKCRYGEVAAGIWGDAEILWEDSEDDYQGHATILARMSDGCYCFYEWWYGSCSGCDTWEEADMSDDEIEAEMRDKAGWFADAECLERWLRRLLKGDIEGYDASRTIDMEVGQMLDVLSGGTHGRLKVMAQAYYEDKKTREVIDVRKD